MDYLKVQETAENYATGNGEVRFEKEAVEETTEKAVEEFFKRRRERRLKNDRARKKAVK